MLWKMFEMVAHGCTKFVMSIPELKKDRFFLVICIPEGAPKYIINVSVDRGR